ncbi:MAG: hypothetical protein R3B70_08725 [Polyangiaceae bacterium]
MSTLKLFNPPANMTDFDGIPGQLEQWSAAVSGWIDESIDSELEAFNANPETRGQKCQFFNATKMMPDGVLLQDIIWNAFPKTLRLAYGLPAAYRLADELVSLTAPRPGLPTSTPFYTGEPWANLYYRPLDEYCEWRLDRDPHTGKILKITFTSEPPEYWQAMHGDTLQNIAGSKLKYQFRGDPKLVLSLYREYVSPYVQYEDLICHEDFVSVGDDGEPVVVYQKGAYNPYNKWNSTHGIMHLGQPNNTISAEIKLGADATILRRKGTRLVTVADALVCCAGYGGTSRSSDPTIGGSVNALARLGAYITIDDPIGLYMHDLNTEGWTKPNGEPIHPDEYFKVLRGNKAKGQIERAELSVPEKEGFTVSDIRIGGVPIRFGGQVAEHINIKLTGLAGAIGTFDNKALPCATKCCIKCQDPTTLTRVIDKASPCPDGYHEAFQHDQGTFAGTEQKGNIRAS